MSNSYRSPSKAGLSGPGDAMPDSLRARLSPESVTHKTTSYVAVSSDSDDALKTTATGDTTCDSQPAASGRKRYHQ